jgi:hypothetical protein
MNPTEELYSVFLKTYAGGKGMYFTLQDMVPSYTGNPTKVINILLSRDRLFIYFEDGSRMVTGYDTQNVDLFYRPINTNDNEGKENVSV